MSDISETAIIGLPNYDLYVDAAFSAMKFKGKTLNEWEGLIDIPFIDEHLSHDELKELNFKFINVSRLILSNLAFARTSLKACEMHYESKLTQAKISIRDDLREKHPGARMPSIDMINSMAENSCIEAAVAKNIAEMFLSYWQTQYDKIRIVDSRLQGLGYLYGLEAKVGHI